MAKFRPLPKKKRSQVVKSAGDIIVLAADIIIGGAKGHPLQRRITRPPKFKKTFGALVEQIVNLKGPNLKKQQWALKRPRFPMGREGKVGYRFLGKADVKRYVELGALYRRGGGALSGGPEFSIPGLDVLRTMDDVPMPSPLRSKTVIVTGAGMARSLGLARFIGTKAPSFDIEMGLLATISIDPRTEIAGRTLSGWFTAFQTQIDAAGQPPIGDTATGLARRMGQPILYTRGSRGAHSYVLSGPGSVRIDGKSYGSVGRRIPKFMEGRPVARAFPLDRPATWKGPIVMLGSRKHAVVTDDYGGGKRTKYTRKQRRARRRMKVR